MFRIKTDIRQFNCETEEKVVKLIKSWVIRPTDLIYDASGKVWEPIGDHPDFEPLFTSLHQKGDEEQDATGAPKNGSSPHRAAILKGRGKIRRDDAESSEPLPLPDAPDEVEGVLRDSDEITVMTDRTADLLGIEGEGIVDADDEDEEAPLPVPKAPDGVEGVAESEEKTEIYERDEDEEGAQADSSDDDGDVPEADASASSEYELEEFDPDVDEEDDLDEDSEPRMGRHDLPEELFLTNEISRPEDAQDSDPEQSLLDELGENAPVDDEPEGEEVTEQIESPLDDEPTSDVDDAWGEIDTAEALRSTDELERDGDDEEDDDRATIELDAASRAEEDAEEVTQRTPLKEVLEADRTEHQASEEASSSAVDNIVIDEEYSREVSGDAPAPAHTPDAASAPRDDEEVAPAPLQADEAPAPKDNLFGEEGIPPEVGEGAIVEGDEAPSAEGEEDLLDVTVTPVDPEEVETAPAPAQTQPGVHQNRDFVSEGYAMDLPVDAGPSQADIKAGLARTDASREEKDLAFPEPLPKRPGELVSRRFGYGDPPVQRASPPMQPGGGASDAELNQTGEVLPLDVQRVRRDAIPVSGNHDEGSAEAADEPDYSLFVIGVGALFLLVIVVTLIVALS